MRKWTSIILCIILLAMAAGCKSKPEPSGAKHSDQVADASGRYVERQIPLPLPDGFSKQSVLGIGRNGDTLNVFTYAYSGDAEERFYYFRHTIASDGTVTTADEPWLNQLAPKGGNSLSLICADNGTLYMAYFDYDEEANSVAHILVSSDDGVSGAALNGDGIASLSSITSIGVLDDGSIVAADFYGGAALLLDAQGNLIEQLDVQANDLVPCVARGNRIACPTPGGKAVRVFDRTAGTSTDYDFAFQENSVTQLALGADGSVFLADSTGLYRRAANGTLWERLVEGSVSTLGMPNFYPIQLLVDSGADRNTLYLCGLDSVYSYALDQDAAATADKELTVFSLTPNETVRQAVVVFGRERGDVKVTYTVVMDGSSGGTEQDYIKALNTELLAGTGPDILILDGLPVDSYIEKDVLVDLADVVAQAEPVEEKLRAAFEADGKLYAMPTGFAVPLAVAADGTGPAFGSLSALAEAAEQAGEIPLLSNCAFSFQTLSSYLLKYYGGALRSGDKAGISAFLTDAKRISESTGCTDRLGEGWRLLNDMPQEELYETFSKHIGPLQIPACIGGSARAILAQPITSIYDSMQILAVADQRGAAITDINRQFVPVGIVGINKAGQEQEAAASFVQMLLSYAAQGGNQYAAQFPVNRQALSEMIAQENDAVSSGYNLDSGESFVALWPSKAWRDRLYSLIQNLDTPIVEQTALRDMLQPEIVAYLNGGSALEQAVDRIGSLLGTYLSE